MKKLEKMRVSGIDMTSKHHDSVYADVYLCEDVDKRIAELEGLLREADDTIDQLKSADNWTETDAEATQYKIRKALEGKQ